MRVRVFICEGRSGGAVAVGGGRGDMMFDIVALHAGIYRALVYAVIKKYILLQREMEKMV